MLDIKIVFNNLGSGNWGVEQQAISDLYHFSGQEVIDHLIGYPSDLRFTGGIIQRISGWGRADQIIILKCLWGIAPNLRSHIVELSSRLPPRLSLELGSEICKSAKSDKELLHGLKMLHDSGAPNVDDPIVKLLNSNSELAPEIWDALKDILKTRPHRRISRVLSEMLNYSSGNVINSILEIFACWPMHEGLPYSKIESLVLNPIKDLNPILAFRVLENSQNGINVKNFLPFLSQSNNIISEVVLSTFVKMNSKEAIEGIVSQVVNINIVDRQRYYDCLELFSPSLVGPILKKTLLNAKNIDVNLLSILGSCKSVGDDDFFIKLLNTSDLEVKITCVHALAKRGDIKLDWLLISHLDESHALNGAIASALSERVTQDRMPMYIQILQRSFAADAYARRIILERISQVTDVLHWGDDEIHILQDLVYRSDSYERDLCIKLLGNFSNSTICEQMYEYFVFYDAQGCLSLSRIIASSPGFDLKYLTSWAKRNAAHLEFGISVLLATDIAGVYKSQLLKDWISLNVYSIDKILHIIIKQLKLPEDGFWFYELFKSFSTNINFKKLVIKTTGNFDLYLSKQVINDYRNGALGNYYLLPYCTGIERDLAWEWCVAKDFNIKNQLLNNLKIELGTIHG